MKKRLAPASAKIIPFRMPPDKAQAIIRETAKRSEMVILGSHAKSRCAQRDFIKDDVLRALRLGCIKGDPEQTELKEWKCKIVARIRGSRDVGVITIILHNGYLFVKTVEWEDWCHG